jgi:hypothetical protein
MKIRRPHVVLIAFAVASWLGAVLELGAAAGCSDHDCQEHRSTVSGPGTAR